MSGDRSAWGGGGRLEAVRRLLARELREQGEGLGDPVRLLGLNTGDGLDVLPVLAGSPATVRATLVEPDPDLAAAARGTARELRLDVDVRCADPGTTDAYAGALPVDVLLLRGILGDVAEVDLASTVDALPGLLAPESLVLWWADDDGGGQGRAAHEAFGRGPFEEVGSAERVDAGTGAYRFTGRPRPPAPGVLLLDLL